MWPHARTLDLERANADLRCSAWTVSHDLRAPLRAVQNYLPLLAQEEGEHLSTDGPAVLELVPNPLGTDIKVAHLPVARADVTMVRQLFQNLIGNAPSSSRPFANIRWSKSVVVHQR